MRLGPLASAVSLAVADHVFSDALRTADYVKEVADSLKMVRESKELTLEDKRRFYKASNKVRPSLSPPLRALAPSLMGVAALRDDLSRRTLAARRSASRAARASATTISESSRVRASCRSCLPTLRIKAGR